MFFKDIVGQEEIKKQLIKNVQENKIAHAQLFCGGEGIGKLPLAIAYARYISCLHPSEEDACGKCANCIKLALSNTFSTIHTFIFINFYRIWTI